MKKLIYLEDAIEAINTWDKFGVDERNRIIRWHEGLEPYVHLRDVLTAIVNMPSAQPGAEDCDRPCTEDDYWNCNDCDHMEVCRYYPMKVCEYKSQPPAQPEPKRGRWIEKHHAYSDEESVIKEWQSCRCSECGRYDTRPYMYYFSEPNYCSYCGADMRGENHETDKGTVVL